MDREFDEELITWTKNAVIHFDKLGWFTDKEFSFFDLNSFLDRDTVAISDLPSDQLDFLVEKALDDLLIYEFLEKYVHDALKNSLEIPTAVLNLCANVFCGNIQRPRKPRSNKKDMEDYTLLLIAEVLAAKFQINKSRNDASQGAACAFDYLELCLRELKRTNALSANMTRTFNSLSRLRSSKEKVAQRVDDTLRLIGPIAQKR